MINLSIFSVRDFGSNVDRMTAKRLGQWATRLYIIMLIFSVVLLAIFSMVQVRTLTNTFNRPSFELYNQLKHDHADKLSCSCSIIASTFNSFVNIKAVFHEICLSPFVSDQWRINLTAGLVPDLSTYAQNDYRRFLSAHLQFLQGLCQLSTESVNNSIKQFLSSLFITADLLSEENFHERLNLLINESRVNAPSVFARVLYLIRSVNDGNAFVSTYGTNFKYSSPRERLLPFAAPTEAVIYDDECSCGLYSNCTSQARFIKTNSFETISIKGLKIGCTPSESLLVSTLECFYNQSCIDLIEEYTNYTSNVTHLSSTTSRFTVNTSITELVHNLFIEEWATTTNYSLYFKQCSPLLCSYTFTENFNVFHTITLLLSLQGGLTIILKWICPTIIRIIDKISDCRKVITLSNSNKALTMNCNKIEPQSYNTDDTTQTSTTSSGILCRYFRKRNLTWFIFWIIIIILILLVVIIPTVIILKKKIIISKAISTTITTTITTIKKDTAATTTTTGHISTKWIQDGIRVAGGNGQGDQLNQLHWPGMIYFDDNNQILYVVDEGNHRIVEWKSNVTTGQVVAGGNGNGSRTDQLSKPTSMVVDINNDSFIICDSGNRRVVQWFRRNDSNQQIIISNIHCHGLAMDNNGNLYVTDWDKHEVSRWKQGDKNGIIVAGRNNQSNKLNELDHPTSIFVDQDYSVYVCDMWNHRVVKWLKNAKEGVVVAGGDSGGGFATSVKKLRYPGAMIVDRFGNVYVADSNNDRIMRWLKLTDSIEGRIIVGGNGVGNGSNQLNWPSGLLFDRKGNLYVSDRDANRVQKFDVDLN
ncbi:unnamed protein product [Adineta steineri]|uniref:NHL repeat containing protein-like protein n=3 Tax=Adineta steineri TaxID=433720 RepID=A0A814IQH8_9BILA|nr:unnamed protein product [Adineta steineri]